MIVAGLFALSCTEEGDARLRVMLTDAPAEFQQVNIEIEQVRLKMASDTTSFFNLETNAGIYDLLQLQNGVDTTLVDDEIPAGVIKEIRLILGNDNTVMVDSTLFDLMTPSAHTSGYKIKLTRPVEADMIEEVTIDFDAEASIVETGNGGYLLEPVLRLVE